MPTPYYAFTVSDYVIGKPISFEEWRSAIQNPLAIAEGASGAPRIVVPTALSTAETNTAKRLRPNGLGGVEWVTDVGDLIILTGSGTWTPPATGTILIIASGGGGGGGGGGGDIGGISGAAGVVVRSTLSVTSGVGVSYSVGAAGSAGVGTDGGNGGDTTLGSMTAPGGAGGVAGTSDATILWKSAFAGAGPGSGGGGGGSGGGGGDGTAGQAGYLHIQYIA